MLSLGAAQRGQVRSGQARAEDRPFRDGDGDTTDCVIMGPPLAASARHAALSEPGPSSPKIDAHIDAVAVPTPTPRARHSGMSA
jgi:hypothetical protein